MQNNSGPWYKHFWPWFMLTLIGTVVIASLITAYIAIEGSDDMVTDNYYKDGLGINMSLEQDALAVTLNTSATITLEGNSLRLTLDIDAEKPDQLILKFLHPTSDTLDKQVFVFLEQDGRYLGNVDLPNQRFYVQIQGSHQGQFWRLSGEFNPSNKLGVTLQSH